MYDSERLKELFKKNEALRFGDFTLASGRKSTYFMDAKLVTLHAEGLRLVCQGLFDLLDDLDFDSVGGMSMGADPIVAGMLMLAAERQQELLGYLVRQESKGRGTNKFVEGPLRPGLKIVVIDDVVTTGGSAIVSAERLVDVGCDVVCVVGIVDRLEGGAQNFADKGFVYRSLLTIEDFGITPPEDIAV